MTYCALLALAVLRDDYAALDRPALARMVGACQVADGGYVGIAITRSFFKQEHIKQIRYDSWSRRR